MVSERGDWFRSLASGGADLIGLRHSFEWSLLRKRPLFLVFGFWRIFLGGDLADLMRFWWVCYNFVLFGGFGRVWYN